jgi:hypothetical protein
MPIKIGIPVFEVNKHQVFGFDVSFFAFSKNDPGFHYSRATCDNSYSSHITHRIAYPRFSFIKPLKTSWLLLESFKETKTLFGSLRFLARH